MEEDQKPHMKSSKEKLNIWKSHYTEGVGFWECKHCKLVYTEGKNKARDKYHAHLLTDHVEVVWEPCQRAVREKFLAQAIEEMRLLPSQIESIQTRVSLSLTFWENHEGLNYMLTRVHNVGDKFGNTDRILDVRRLPIRWDTKGSQLYYTVVQVAQEHKIDFKKVIMCTYEEKGLGGLLTKHLDTLKTEDPPKLKFLRCIGSFIEGVLQEFLSSNGDLLKKGQQILSILTDPTYTINEAFNNTVQSKFEVNETVKYSKAWKPTYIILTLLSEMYKEINDAIVVHQFQDGVALYDGDEDTFLLTDAEKETLKHVVDFLSKFYEATNTIERVDSTWFGDWLFILVGLADYTTRYLRENDHVNLPVEFCKSVSLLCSKMNTFVDSIGEDRFLYKCVLVDVCRKSKLIERVFPGAQFQKGKAAIEHVQRIYRQDCSAEVASYLHDNSYEMGQDIAQWWEVNNENYPSVGRLARDFLSVRGSCRSPKALFTSSKAVQDREYYDLEGGVEAQVRYGLLLSKNG